VTPKKLREERDRYRKALEDIKLACTYKQTYYYEVGHMPRFLVSGKTVVKLVDEALGEKR